MAKAVSLHYGERINDLRRSLSLVRHAAPVEATALLICLAVQGLIPAALIWITKSVIDIVAAAGKSGHLANRRYARTPLPQELEHLSGSHDANASYMLKRQQMVLVAGDKIVRVTSDSCSDEGIVVRVRGNPYYGGWVDH